MSSATPHAGPQSYPAPAAVQGNQDYLLAADRKKYDELRQPPPFGIETRAFVARKKAASALDEETVLASNHGTHTSGRPELAKLPAAIQMESKMTLKLLLR